MNKRDAGAFIRFIFFWIALTMIIKSDIMGQIIDFLNALSNMASF